ncbi:uncharacterized protein EDB91DRAFT_1251683 [Suillus paluster]|uniref:uncharacterized protein n=1 Tax=Suillus paluster TaxID=48578 RepID=UPI001B85EEC6|nr:uncharacterized protein EDB91DRAFT_1251683 [Suillus paluster]KAG1732631.1 hypothetical protein EDB91DRAFT_1251683 [Suillus paluster]
MLDNLWALRRVVLARPWLVGAKGVISLPRKPPSSLLAKPTERDFKFREGHISQYKATLATLSFNAIEGFMFTLLDTVLGTIYYVHVHRPPTICLFTGTEGGQRRFVLCGEECNSSELRRETVLCVPSFISTRMNACDWVALGGEK